jgi:hypothetical protein
MMILFFLVASVDDDAISMCAKDTPFIEIVALSASQLI